MIEVMRKHRGGEAESKREKEKREIVCVRESGVRVRVWCSRESYCVRG